MKKLTIFLLAFIFTFTVFANDVPVLVIDSGTDFSHDKLAPHALDDGGVQGYPGDKYGWNFVDNDNVLVNLDHTPPKYDDVLKFLELMGIFQLEGKEGLTQEEFNFLAQNYQNEEIMQWVQFVGGWAHGTHCGGIASEGVDEVKLKAIKHLPTGDAPRHIEEMINEINYLMKSQQRRSTETVSMDEIAAYFDMLGQQMKDEVSEIRDYIGALEPRVINCSFGSENSNLVNMFKQTMVEEWGYVNPSDEEVQEVVNLFVERAFQPRDKEMFSKVPNALILIAAGNSGENIENILVSPNNTPIKNKLVVAATHDDKALAPFSDYAESKVDVAVPGVNILAPYPNNKMGRMSGTSQAAPLAAKYAAQVLSVNPDLSATDVKGILMGTVDKKSWLEGKVRANGVINPDRAEYAAELTLDGKTLGQAIAISKREVSDRSPETRRAVGPQLPRFETELEQELYWSTIF
ncbi:MAG: S8 family serine peptidase [Candidatus Muiribacteriota bacterium]